jgi:hypothetical protein
MSGITTIDIVKLVEDTPITRFNGNYQHKLINKLEQRFTNDTQQMFLGSFYCYLNYNSRMDFVIDLDTVWEWLGFSKKQRAKELLLKHFEENKDYKTEAVTRQSNCSELSGGTQREKIMLTTRTFKSFCLKANTKKAKEIHEYFIDLEEVIQEYLNEETDELRLSIEFKSSQLQTTLENNDINLKQQKNDILMEKFSNKKCIYLNRLSDNLIKIGSTKDILSRKVSLDKIFGSGLFVDAFECNNFRDIENKVLNDPTIKPNLYRDKLLTGHISNEVVRLTDSFTYEHLRNIINKYLNNLLDLTNKEILEHKRLDLENKRLSIIEKLVENNPNTEDITNYLYTIEKLLQLPVEKDREKEHINHHTIPKEQEVLSFCNVNTTVFRQKPKGNFKSINKIDPITLNTLHTYESFQLILDDRPEVARSSLITAIKSNKIYNKFRWNYVDTPINDTAEIKYSSKIIPIVELNKERTQILNIYPTMKELAKVIESHPNIIRNKMKTDTEINGKFYMKQNECSKELLHGYNGISNIYTYPISKRIRQTNILTKQETYYNSMNDVCKIMAFDHRTLTKAINGKYNFHGSVWNLIQ